MRPRKRLAVFRNDVLAMSAVEFAIIFPLMLMLMLGAVQLVIYINAVRKVELLASSISETISQAVPPSQSSTATVNYQDLHFAYDSAIVIFPYLMMDAANRGIPWWQDIVIDFASVQFAPIPGTCGAQPDQSACFIANVVWTSSGTVGGNSRPCLIPQLPTTSNVSNKATLPAAVYGPGSIIVIDVAYTFKPIFGSNLIGSLTIARSVYVQPRYANLIKYDTTNSDGIAVECLGY